MTALYKAFARVALVPAVAATFLAGTTAANAAKTGISTAYILADGKVGAGPKYATSVLNGSQYTITFTNQQPTGFCSATVTPNVGQFGIPSARVIAVNPLQVNVIMMGASGSAITSSDFYLTVACV